MTATPFLARWFALMVSDAPGRVLELISDDFTMSVQFSKGAGAAAEFTGDHAGLVDVLAHASSTPIPTDRNATVLASICRTP